MYMWEHVMRVNMRRCGWRRRDLARPITDDRGKSYSLASSLVRIKLEVTHESLMSHQRWVRLGVFLIGYWMGAYAFSKELIIVSRLCNLIMCSPFYNFYESSPVSHRPAVELYNHTGLDLDLSWAESYLHADVRGRDLIGMALTGFQTDARSRGDLIGRPISIDLKACLWWGLFWDSACISSEMIKMLI